MKYLIIIMCLIPTIILGAPNMSFYGDIQRWWVGTVEEGSAGSDPNNLGRCRVRIDGIHGSDISLNDLPYAQTILPCTGGGTSGIGENPQLLPGAQVTGFFLDGMMSQLPVIYGYLPHIGIPTIAQTKTIDSAKKVILSQRTSSGSLPLERNQIVTSPNYVPRSRDIDNISQIWNFFSDKSSAAERPLAYKSHHIAGIIGNLIHESGSNKNLTISTTVISGVEGENSQGIAQWNPATGRLQKLQKYARERGIDAFDLLTQCAFIDHELRTYKFLNRGFFNTTTVEQAAMHFMRYYLRPTWCKTGSVKAGTCVSFGTTTRFPSSQGGEFPGGVNQIRAGEEGRLEVAIRIYEKYTQVINTGPR